MTFHLIPSSGEACTGPWVSTPRRGNRGSERRTFVARGHRAVAVPVRHLEAHSMRGDSRPPSGSENLGLGKPKKMGKRTKPSS